MEAEARAQLDFMGRVHALLEDAGIAHWLGGGWAVDFSLGRVTRIHDDIDFAIWHADWPKVEALLGPHGFMPKPPQFADESRFVEGGPVQLDFWLLVLDAQGRPVVGGRWAGWPFVDGAFDNPPCTFEHVTCRVLSVEALINSKAAYPDQPAGAPMRPKDVQDVAKLRELLSRTQA